MKYLTNKYVRMYVVAAIALVAISMIAGHPIIPADAMATFAALGAAPFMMGDTENVSLVEIKKLIDDQGTAWEEFKKTNDAIMKAKADGKAVGELETKLAKISETLDKVEEAKSAMEATLARIQRESLAGGSSKSKDDLELEIKGFNLHRKSWSLESAPRELDASTYTAYKNAYWQLVRKGNAALLSGEEQKALQAGADSDGGYLMPTPAVGRVVARLFELSPMRQICSVQSISTEALEGLEDNDEASFGWVAEQGARAETNTPQVGKYRIEAHEMYASPKATQKLLDDAAVDVEAWLAGKVANKFARAEAAAFITGTGAGQPFGFTSELTAATADATRPWGTLEIKATGVAGDFAVASPGDILFDLIGAFKQGYLQNARFVTRREVIAKIRKFKEATTNAYMWQPGLQAGQPDKLLGYPVTIAQDMPALGANSLSMGFGDFAEGYQIVDRIGIRTLRDPYTNKPFVIFYSTKRTGGRVLNFEAIKLVKFG